MLRSTPRRREARVAALALLLLALVDGCHALAGVEEKVAPEGTSPGGNGGAGGASGVAGTSGASGVAGKGGGGGASGTGGASGASGKGGAYVAGPDDLVLDVLPTGLGSSFLPYEDQRRPAVLDAIAHLDSDVVCVLEVARATDRMLLVDAALSGGKLVHSVVIPTSNATPTDDPTDINGQLQTPPSPSCAGPQKAKLDDMLDCLRTNCSTIPGSDAGRVSDAACVSGKCASVAAPLVLGTATEDRTCYGCLTPQLVSETFGDIRESCENGTTPGLGFAGQNAVLLLSRYPLVNPRLHVLPSSWFRRTIVEATVQRPGKAAVDAYCTMLSSVAQDDTFFPYTGVFGAGTSTNGWENENYLQATKLVAFVKATSPGPAVVMGILASPAISDASGAVVSKPSGAKAINLLLGQFPEAVAPGYVPACTLCPDNPLLSTVDLAKYAPAWLAHVLLHGLPVSAVRHASRTFTTPTVPVTSSMGLPIKVPLATNYGMRAVVTLP